MRLLQTGNVTREFLKNSENKDPSLSRTNKSRFIAALSYFFPIIPYIKEKQDEFIKFHASQGMNMMLIFILYYIFGMLAVNLIKIKKTIYYGIVTYKVTPLWVYFFVAAVGIYFTLMNFWGMIGALKGEFRDIPIVSKIKIFK